MVLLQIDVCCEAFAQISPNLPSPGEGTGEPMLALWEGVGRHHLHTWEPRPLAAQVAAGWPREAKSWAPGYGRVFPGPSPSAPGSLEETWGCSHTSPPRSQAPSPSLFFCLRRSRPAQTCLLFSPAGSRSFPGNWRGPGNAGAHWEAPGPPPWLSWLSGVLQPGFSPPTLECRFPGFYPDIAIFAKEALNG